MNFTNLAKEYTISLGIWKLITKFQQKWDISLKVAACTIRVPTDIQVQKIMHNNCSEHALGLTHTHTYGALVCVHRYDYRLNTSLLFKKCKWLRLISLLYVFAFDMRFIYKELHLQQKKIVFSSDVLRSGGITTVSFIDSLFFARLLLSLYRVAATLLLLFSFRFVHGSIQWKRWLLTVWRAE